MLVASGHMHEFRFLWRPEALDRRGAGAAGTALPDREAHSAWVTLPALALHSAQSRVAKFPFPLSTRGP